MTPHPVASRLRRALPILLSLYALLLLVAALPRPVRPAVLDAPHALADQVLRRFAIRGGISVFQPPQARIVDVLRNDCIVVRGRRSDASPEALQPPAGRCVTSGVRLGVPPIEWFLRSVLTGGEATLGELHRQAVIGDFFCHAPAWRARRFDDVELLWTQPSFDIDTGAERTANVLYFRWRCDPPGLAAMRTQLADDEVRALWGDTAP